MGTTMVKYTCKRCQCIVEDTVVYRYCSACRKIVHDAHAGRQWEKKK